MPTDSAKPKYYIYLDTSTLRGKNSVSIGIDEFIKKSKDDGRIDIHFIITDVVASEWIKQFCINLRSTLKDARMHLKYSDEYNTPLDENLEDVAREYLKGAGIEVVATDYQDIDTKDLVERAIESIPPFKGGDDKDDGFKDGVIVQSIMSNVETRKLSSQDKLVYLVRDDTHKEYILELCNTKGLVIDTYSSYQELDDAIGLHLNKLSIDLSKKASDYFYIPQDNKAYFYKEKVTDQIVELYKKDNPSIEALKKRISAISEDPSSSTEYSASIPLSADWTDAKGVIQVSKTIFKGIDGNKISWETVIVYQRLYEVENQFENVITGLAGILTHTVEYTVTWSSVLTQRNNLSRFKLHSITSTNEYQQYKPEIAGGGSSLYGRAFDALMGAKTNATTISGLPTVSVPPSIQSLQSINDMVKSIQEQNKLTMSSIGKSLMAPSEAMRSTLSAQAKIGDALRQSALAMRTVNVPKKPTKPKDENKNKDKKENSDESKA